MKTKGSGIRRSKRGRGTKEEKYKKGKKEEEKEGMEGPVRDYMEEKEGTKDMAEREYKTKYGVLCTRGRGRGGRRQNGGAQCPGQREIILTGTKIWKCKKDLSQTF